MKGKKTLNWNLLSVTLIMYQSQGTNSVLQLVRPIESFNKSLEFLNPGEGSRNCNMLQAGNCKFVMTLKSKVWSKAKIDDLVTEWICSFTFRLSFQILKVKIYKVFDNMNKFLLYFSGFSPDFSFKRSNR